MKGTVCKDSSLFIVRAVAGICSGCAIFLIVTALQRFGHRGRGIAAPDHRKVFRRVACAEVEAVRRSEGYGDRAGESVCGVESAQPLFAGDQQRRVVVAIGDQLHRFAHQLAGQSPAAEFGSRRHAVDIGRAAQLASNGSRWSIAAVRPSYSAVSMRLRL